MAAPCGHTQVRDAFHNNDGSHTPVAAAVVVVAATALLLLHLLMRFLGPLLTALGLTGSVHDRPSSVGKLDAYIAQETHTAKSCLLANIGPDGAKSHGALVRTPRHHSPPRVVLIHLYSWTRDSALVFKLLIEDFVSGDDLSLRGLIDAYITAESLIQQTPNPSGAAGKDGLGEPKFNIDGSPFLRPWGRPQRGTKSTSSRDDAVVADQDVVSRRSSAARDRSDAVRRLVVGEWKLVLCGEVIVACHPIGSRLCRRQLEAIYIRPMGRDQLVVVLRGGGAAPVPSRGLFARV